MKEDILEQLVDDYLQAQGYFTLHNVKFRPRKDHPDFNTRMDSNHSDIDVLGFHPNKKGVNRIIVASCKSWQAGFHVQAKLAELSLNKKRGGREAWQGFRELMKSKWSKAFIDTIETITGSRKFTYLLAVTAIHGDRQQWEQHTPFIRSMEGNPIKLISLREIIDHLECTSTTTPASSDIGRILQLMRAANVTVSKKRQPA